MSVLNVANTLEYIINIINLGMFQVYFLCADDLSIV